MSFSLKQLLKNQDWLAFFQKQWNQSYWEKLENKLASEKKKKKNIYPQPENIFRIFNQLSPQNIKIVILGQDPYHQKGQADGLAFSSKADKLPASLKNIYQEIYKNKNLKTKNLSGDLSRWVQQGVFLLNRILTVQESKALSHKNFGWQELTQQTLAYLNQSPKCFMLWGAEAQKAKEYLQNKKHYILETSHPSPLSVYRGFAGCQHFQKANRWLKSQNQKPIVWDN